MIDLAHQIVRDGEGASKFVTVNISGAKSAKAAKKIGLTIANSPLVKTALFASDPNWGRILAAVGRAGVETLKLSDIDIAIGPQTIVRNGEPALEYDERAVAEVMAETDIDIAIRIGNGAAQVTVWTCDLSYDYVKINAEYRS